MGVLRAACIQMRSGCSMQRNLEQMETLVREAAARGAVYVQTPEMTGLLQKNPVKLLASIYHQADDPIFAVASTLASELGIWLHIGSTPIALADTDQSGRAANRGGIFAPDGKCTAIYDKIHMFDVAVDEQNTWKESNRYTPGDVSIVVEMSGVKIGVSICYDIRFPALYRHQARMGASILTCPASFTVPTGKAHWEILLRARAIENNSFMLAAAQGGNHEDGRQTYGHSMMINPWGKIIGELAHDEPGILVCDLDLDEVGQARRMIPNLTNERDYSLNSVGF